MGAALSRVLRMAGGALGLVAVLALGLLPAPREVHATTFNPGMSVALSNPTPGGVTNMEFTFSLEAPDAAFESIVTFIPAEFFIASDDAVPDGALGGVLNARPTIGQVNNPCSTTVSSAFNLLREPIDGYPYFLSKVAPGAEPRAIYHGWTEVAGADTTVDLAIFEPGAEIPKFPAFDPALGYPAMFFINDPTQIPERLGLSDLCSPIHSTLTLYGTSRNNPLTNSGGGATLIRAPENAGSYNTATFIRSRWDADNDGIENQLDVCALVPNPNWNPRLVEGDRDNDALPDDCDPTTAHNTDADGDNYLNRQDICPLDQDTYPPDTDHDLIGDACDPFPKDPANGGAAHRHQLCLFHTFVVGAGGPVGPSAECPTGPDLPSPLSLIVDPSNWVRPVATIHTIDAYVRDPTLDYYANLDGLEVTFEVTGANPTAGTCITEPYGDCEFSYLGTNLGDDTVVISTEYEGRAVSETVIVRWMTPPANDDFLNGEDILQFPATFSAAIPAASSPSTEPDDCDSTPQTVWFDLVSETDRYVRMEASTEGMYAYLGLYSNQPVGGFRPVACGYEYYEEPGPDDIPEIVENYLFAHLRAGRTYHLQVSGGSLGSTMPVDVTVEIEDAIEGDTDCDGDFEVDDVMLILQSMLEEEEPPECYGAGDWRCSGYISPGDILPPLSRLAGVGAPIEDCVPGFNGPIFE